MLVMSITGFFLARDVFSPKFLQPSKVQGDRPHPIRVLSPEEAARASMDKDSSVWTEGVKSSDIPKMTVNTERVYDDSDVTNHARRHDTGKKKKSVRRSEGPDDTVLQDQPADNAPSPDNATDGGPTTDNKAEPDPATTE